MDIKVLADLLARKAHEKKLTSRNSHEKRNDRPRRFMDGLSYDEWLIEPNYENS